MNDATVVVTIEVSDGGSFTGTTIARASVSEMAYGSAPLDGQASSLDVRAPREVDVTGAHERVEDVVSRAVAEVQRKIAEQLEHRKKCGIDRASEREARGAAS